MKSTILDSLMTTGELAEAVERLITPENGDAEARTLIRIIQAVADFENPVRANMANEAIKAAYAQTEHFAAAVNAALGEFVAGGGQI